MDLNDRFHTTYDARIGQWFALEKRKLRPRASPTSVRTKDIS